MPELTTHDGLLLIKDDDDAEVAISPGILLPSIMGIVQWTFDPMHSVTTAVHGTGNIHGSAVILRKGQVINYMGIYCSSAAVAPTHFFCGIYDKDFNLLVATPDAPSTLLGTGFLEIQLATPFKVPRTGLYYFADLMAASTTMPTTLVFTTVTQQARSQMPGAPFRSFNPGGSFAAFPNPIVPSTSGAFTFIYAR